MHYPNTTSEREDQAVRVALYLRVSTKGQDVEPQRLRLRALAESRGWEVVAEFVDVASGRQDRRAALSTLMREARRRAFDAVAVVKLDRLARSTAHLCRLAEELEAAGVDLVAADQAFDTSTAAGRLLFGVLATVAQFEADLIRERTRDGLAAAVRRGVKLGRPAALDREGVARARRLAEAGRSVREVAKLLGVSLGTAHAAMRS